jgi:transcriptional regulator with XRE-family HTH domain
MIDERQVPKKIRQMRLDRNMTQQDLAVAAGLTKGYISRIENADSAPPVGTLIALAQAMKVQFNDFFETDSQEAIVTVTRKDERPRVGSDNKAPLKYEHLAIGFPNRAFESYVVEFPPKSGMSLPNQHNGQELLFVMKGVMEFMVDDQSFVLHEGDAMHFNSSYRHKGRCLSEEKAEVLCIIWDGKNLSR